MGHELQLLTLEEARALLGLPSNQSVTRLARRSGASLVKLGHRTLRIRQDDVARLIEQHREIDREECHT